MLPYLFAKIYQVAHKKVNVFTKESKRAICYSMNADTFLHIYIVLFIVILKVFVKTIVVVVVVSIAIKNIHILSNIYYRLTLQDHLSRFCQRIKSFLGCPHRPARAGDCVHSCVRDGQLTVHRGLHHSVRLVCEHHSPWVSRVDALEDNTGDEGTSAGDSTRQGPSRLHRLTLRVA